jgi:hypothetical protein
LGFFLREYSTKYNFLKKKSAGKKKKKKLLGWMKFSENFGLHFVNNQPGRSFMNVRCGVYKENKWL